MEKEKKYICTDCGCDATVAMTQWKDVKTKKSYYKKGERRCLPCHKKFIGVSIF